MSRDELVDEWCALIHRVASFVSSDFPDVETEELESKLFVVVTERGLWENDPNTDGYAYHLFRRARGFAWEERREHLILTSQYSYRTKDISALLETLFDKRLWNEAIVPDDAKSFENWRNTDGIEMSSDVSWAFDKLPKDHQRAIFCRYALQERPARGSAEYKYLQRAKARLADILNTYSRPVEGYPGARHPISNATAEHLIRTERNGDFD